MDAPDDNLGGINGSVGCSAQFLCKLHFIAHCGKVGLL